MDDSIKRKIIFHESDMEIDLEWSKLQSRMQEKKRRGVLFFFTLGIITLGLSLIGIQTYNYFSDIDSKSKNQVVNNKEYVDNATLLSKSISPIDDNDENIANLASDFQQINIEKSAQDENIINSNTLNTAKSKNFKSASKKSSSSLSGLVSKKNIPNIPSKITFKESKILEAKAESIQPEKSRNESTSTQLQVEEFSSLPKKHLFLAYTNQFELNYDDNKVLPISRKINLLRGWSLTNTTLGNLKSNANITHNNTNDQNELKRNSLEVLSTSLGLNKTITKNLSLNFGYQYQRINEKMEAKGIGYQIKQISNTLIATGQDQQRIFGASNQVREVKYNLLSYNHHTSNSIFLRPNLHTSLKGYDIILGAKWVIPVNFNYQYENISIEGLSIESSKNAENVKIRNFDLQINWKIYKNLTLGLTGEYMSSTWNYDFDQPSIDPQLIMQSTGLTKYKLNTFLFGVNLSYFLN
jgi:hypothetical protein